MKHDLREANSLYRRGKYTRAIRLLEPQVVRYRENFRFYYILGVSCLRTGDSGGARTYLGRAISIKPHDESSLLGLAVSHLKRYEVSDAIQCYLDIIDENPRSRLARRGLRLIRRNADRDRLAPLIDSRRIDGLLPRDRAKGGIMAVVFLVAILGASGAYVAYRVANRTPREPLVASLTLSASALALAEEGDSAHVLTEDEIRDTFRKAKRYFADYEDNFAIREINRILRSNATPSVREQALMILGFIKPPDFTSIRNAFTYSEVASDPSLYEGTYVRWGGRVSNLKIDESRLRFDLLVGYESSEILEGVVGVEFDFGIDLDNRRPVEVLGAVTIVEGRVQLVGLSLHKLAEQ